MPADTTATTARLAQSVERKALNLVVLGGSSPTVDVAFRNRNASAATHNPNNRRSNPPHHSARSVAASYTPPMLVTRVHFPACAFVSVLCRCVRAACVLKQTPGDKTARTKERAAPAHDIAQGLLQELNPGPLAPEARNIPLDQAANCWPPRRKQ